MIGYIFFEVTMPLHTEKQRYQLITIKKRRVTAIYYFTITMVAP